MSQTRYPVTIGIQPNYSKFSPGFAEALVQAHAAKQETFTYAGTPFHLSYDEDSGKIRKVQVAISGTNVPLPNAFASGELEPGTVVLLCDIPDDLLAKPGWYDGANFGLPNAGCVVDPYGALSGGEPQIYANGTDYANVVTLFNKVMAGELAPGHNGNPLSGVIYANA